MDCYRFISANIISFFKEGYVFTVISYELFFCDFSEKLGKKSLYCKKDMVLKLAVNNCNYCNVLLSLVGCKKVEYYIKILLYCDFL